MKIFKSHKIETVLQELTIFTTNGLHPKYRGEDIVSVKIKKNSWKLLKNTLQDEHYNYLNYELPIKFIVKTKIDKFLIPATINNDLDVKIYSNLEEEKNHYVANLKIYGSKTSESSQALLVHFGLTNPLLKNLR